jgi:hypothetical protein
MDLPLTKQLDTLFDELEKAHESYNGCLKRDGIVDEVRYSNQNTKVLFIAKEPNDPEQTPGDYRTWWMNEGLQFKFTYQLAEWAYGVLNDFPPYLEANKYENKFEALKSVAFMNLKKSGGGATADGSEIYQYAKNTSSFLQKQIKIIAPDIAVCSIGDWGPWECIFPNAAWKQDGNGMWIAKSENTKIVSFGHPSNRYPHVMNYCLLEKIVTSDMFLAL